MNLFGLSFLLFTRTNATAINDILTKAFLNKKIEVGMIKTETSDHFPIFLITSPITSSEIKNKRTLLEQKGTKRAKEQKKNRYKRTFLGTFYQEKPETILKKLEIDNLNEAYSKFLSDFFSFYGEAFPKLEIKVKQKNLLSPRVTKGIMKSSK